MRKETAEALAPVVDAALGVAEVQEGAAVAPAPAPAPVAVVKAAKVSLFDAFDDLQALLDTEEGGIDEAQHAEFEAAMKASKEVAMAKVDRCIQFRSSLRSWIEFHKEQKERIAAHQKRVENALKGFEGYLLLMVDRFGVRKPKSKKSTELKPPVLEGCIGTISMREGGVEVVIEDASAIPPQYLNTTVKLSFPLWASLIDAYVASVAATGGDGEDARVELLRSIKVENTVDEKAVQAAIEAGQAARTAALAAGEEVDSEDIVPGADLRFKEDSLVIR